MKLIKKLITYYHLSSLDVVVGTVASGYAFGRLPDGNQLPNANVLLILACVTWFLYIIDRLLDIRVYPPNHTPRHGFHATYQYNFQVLAIALFLMAIGLVFTLPSVVIHFGLVTGAAVAIYYLILAYYMKNTKLQWIKEPITALFYTIAVAGSALVLQPSITLSSWLLAFNFFLIVLQCILLFSYFEEIQQFENKTIVSNFGEKTTLRIINYIAVFILFISLLFFKGTTYTNWFSVIEIGMTLILSFITTQTAFFLKNNRYRWLGEGVFLLPALLFWF